MKIEKAAEKAHFAARTPLLIQPDTGRVARSAGVVASESIWFVLATAPFGHTSCSRREVSC
jgi:hypothetical protein